MNTYHLELSEADQKALELVARRWGVEPKEAARTLIIGEAILIAKEFVPARRQRGKAESTDVGDK